jgi:hypothetical protein
MEGKTLYEVESRLVPARCDMGYVGPCNSQSVREGSLADAGGIQKVNKTLVHTVHKCKQEV